MSQTRSQSYDKEQELGENEDEDQETTPHNHEQGVCNTNSVDGRRMGLVVM